MGKRAHIGLTIGLAAFAAAVSGSDDGHANPATPKKSVTLQGLVLPSKQVGLGMRVPGVLATRPIMEGQFVESGQLIAELDSEREKEIVGISKLRAATEIAIRAAQADESFRLYELGRQQTLVKEQATSEWEVRAAEISQMLASIQTEQAYFDRALLQAQLVRDRVLLDERRLTAPFSGWISRTLKNEGEPVDEFEPIAVLVQLDPIWIELNVAAEHFGRASAGDMAVVRIGELEKTASVIIVGPLVDAGSSTFRLTVEVDNKDGTLVAGTMAVVELSLHGPSVVNASDAQLAGLRNQRRGRDKGSPGKRVKLRPIWGESGWSTDKDDGSRPTG